ncbi:MAG TPA: multicopper oxidase domain-containing protein [Gaiellaceae bacterium]|nr:multicopper oxidase domain-containing protein [Gaiellaceae bacterium]
MTLVRRLALAAAIVASLVVAAVLARAWWDSRLPGTYNAMQFGKVDRGGAPSSSGRVVSVAALTGSTSGTPDDRFTLTAEHARVRLASGRTVNALTFNGRVPGPELRVHTGDLVEVVLKNKDVKEGVTIHWHGVDVPDADDGVAGVTQNAVPVGGRYVYRFRVEQSGTFWYHTHQDSDSDVRRGLYGAFVIEPRREPPPGTLDLALVAHTLGGTRVLNTTDDTRLRTVRPGTHVRLRLVNSNDTTESFALSGTPFDVLAIDGTDLNRPTPIDRRLIGVPAGGRSDLGFTMPAHPVRLDLFASDAALVLSPDGRTAPAPDDGGWPHFDPLDYGSPAPTPFDARSHFDRSFVLKIQKKLGFENGHPGFHWAINGGLYPHVPMFVVSRGDLVKMTIVNDTSAVHPMHLHGHHMLVLSRNGVPDRGSPWWSDTLEVDPGDRYEVAFRADNPGLWMDHCHNLRHATAGLTMHIMYAGVWTPFKIGGQAHNNPE